MCSRYAASSCPKRFITGTILCRLTDWKKWSKARSERPTTCLSTLPVSKEVGQAPYFVSQTYVCVCVCVCVCVTVHLAADDTVHAAGRNFPVLLWLHDYKKNPWATRGTTCAQIRGCDSAVDPWLQYWFAENERHLWPLRPTSCKFLPVKLCSKKCMRPQFDWYANPPSHLVNLNLSHHQNSKVSLASGVRGGSGAPSWTRVPLQTQTLLVCCLTSFGSDTVKGTENAYWNVWALLLSARKDESCESQLWKSRISVTIQSDSESDGGSDESKFFRKANDWLKANFQFSTRGIEGVGRV